MPIPKWFFPFTFISGIILFLFPEIDLYVSGLFYQDGFYLKHHPFITFIYDITHPLLALIFLGFLFLCIYLCKTKKSSVYGITQKASIFILLSMLIAPGLVVNAGLKDNVDRPRPRHVIPFGGTKPFTPPFVVTNYCEKNCSFVCGHASAGYVLIALAFLFGSPWRLRLFWGSIFIGSGIGLVRIIQGGHFFSDVIFSFVATFLTVWILHRLLFKEAYKS